jgi:hypothetical protein
MGPSSAGEAGGLVAGVVAVLYAVGKAVAWVWQRFEGRIDRRAADNLSEAARLAAWRKALDAEAAEHRRGIRAKLEALELELAELRVQGAALAAGLLDVALELDDRAPESPALARLGETLRKAFKVGADLPAEMRVLLARLDGGKDGGEANARATDLAQ